MTAHSTATARRLRAASHAPPGAGANTCCPACGAGLDGGPVVFWCGGCRRPLHAADLAAEHPLPAPAAGAVAPSACACSWDRPGPACLSAARAQVRAALGRWRLAAAADTVVLAASELLANAFTHGTPPVELRLRLQARCAGWALVCEVRDNGAAMPVLTSAAASSERGRGLAVVTALADTFGVRPHARGKTVWFAIAVPPARPEPTSTSLALALAAAAVALGSRERDGDHDIDDMDPADRSARNTPPECWT